MGLEPAVTGGLFFLFGNGQLSHPQGVTVDSNGNVYVADIRNNKIQVFKQN